MQNKKNGFTMAELIIALVILTILSIVAVPAYRAHVRRSIATEGETLLGEVQVGERAYFFRTGKFLSLSSTSKSVPLGVDFRRNKYFSSFSVTTNTSGTTFTITTNNYKGKALTLSGSSTGRSTVTDKFTSEAA